MNHENECAQERTAAAAKRRRQCQQMLLRAIDAAGSHYCFDRVRLAVLPAAAATVDRITGDATTKACAAKKYASSATICNNVVRRTLDLVPRAQLGTSEARPRTQFVSRLTTFVHHFPAPANCLPHAATAFCVFFFLLLWCAMSNILAQSCISRCLAESRAKLRSTTANSVRVTTDNFRTPLPCSCELSATRCCCLLRVSFSCYGVQCRTYSPRVAYRVVWRRLELNGFSQITCDAFILASVPSWSPTVYWRQSQPEKNTCGLSMPFGHQVT